MVDYKNDNGSDVQVDTSNTKRNNYVDGQFLDVDDLQTEQNYFLQKIKKLSDNQSNTGSVSLKDLQVTPDTVMVESIDSSEVEIAIEASPDLSIPNPQNYTLFPNAVDSSAFQTSLYTVFKTSTTNIQKMNLRVTLGQAFSSETQKLSVEIKQLVDASNPQSSLASTPALARIEFEQNEIPEQDSDRPLVLDFSDENSGQGLAVFEDAYYAILVEYERPTSSTANIRIFHNPLGDTSNVDPKLLTYIYQGSEYSQGFTDVSGIFQTFQIYHKVETSAIKIGPGEAIIEGERVIVQEDQFTFLEIPDRRNVDTDGSQVYNYVVLSYKQDFMDPEVVPSTRNEVNTRIQDSSNIQVLTEPQFEQLLKDGTTNTALLAVVTDTNIVSIYKNHTFEVPANSTNLAFHDWLNPSNTTASQAALLLQQQRSEDFIFYLTNVPAQVPLTDTYGNVQVEPATVRDDQGNVVAQAGDPILDNIVRVVVEIVLDNGKNTRTLELSITDEIGTVTKFRDYAGTITDLFDDPLDGVFSFSYNTDEIAPNVTYNFIAYTTKGLPIYIQDYNKVVTVDDSSTPIRSESYSVLLEAGSRTAVINTDLKLGSFDPSSDQSQPGVTQYVATFIPQETVVPIGQAEIENVVQGDQVLFENSLNDQGNIVSPSFIFPAPMMAADLLTKVENTDQAVTSAYDSGAISVLVDLNDGVGPVDITFSGTDNRDKGGNGAAILVAGEIDASLSLDITRAWQVKLRRADGKDCTNYSSNYSPYGPAEVGGSTNLRSFNIVGRGKDTSVTPLNTAGFEDGDLVYVYVNDSQALGINYEPIVFTFDSSQATIDLGTIFHLGAQSFFREKSILSIQSAENATPGIVLIDTGYANESANEFGQIIFNASEIPTAIVETSNVTIQYNSVTTIPQDIQYYQTKFNPAGTREGLPIANSNQNIDSYISVPEAFAQTASVETVADIDPSTFFSVAIFIEGINVMSPLCPIGQQEVIADDGTALVQNQIAFNPETGTIRFFTSTDGYSSAPSFDKITTAYFKLETKFIFNSSVDVTYEPKFDLNNDGVIDELDLKILNRAMNSQIGEPNYLVSADFNSDGKVDDLDMTLFMDHFGAVSAGTPDYSDATTARLAALLVAEQDNHLNTLKVIKAVSKAPEPSAPYGRTVLFFSEETPVREAKNYDILFGFESALSLGYITAEVETSRPLEGRYNLANVKMYEGSNPTNTRQVIQIEAASQPNENNRYTNKITFTPAINETSTFVIEAQWEEEGIAVKKELELIIPQKYEELDRKLYGPFSLQYDENDFEDDGTSICFTVKATDATLADGTPDPTGKHIAGVPLSELAFTIHLMVANTNNTTSLWTWHNVVPQGLDNKIVLEYSSDLFIEHRQQGKDGAEVLTPFGLGDNQVALKPKYAGGDLINNLGNISVMRSDVQSRYVQPHTHTSDRDGGILTSRSIQFEDDLARLNMPANSDVTDAVYTLYDIIQEQAKEIDQLKSLEGTVRWDRGLYWDDPTVFWDQD